VTSPPGNAPSTSYLDRFQPLLTVLLIVAIGVGAGAFVLGRPPAVTITVIPPAPTGTPAPTLTPGPIQVYVTGAVARPDQIVAVPHGSRVADAVEAAGGLTADADRGRTNLADILRDGDQVHVFARADGDGEVSALVLATPSDHGIVYLNSSTQEELETLPRIGPAMAERIIIYREINGSFAALDDLLNVDGIGPSTLEAIRPFVSLEMR
jgi:competence protein ComEA